jgi:rRNA-processing protein FCF1
MYKYLESLVSKYSNKGILVDSNILLLYFIGSYDSNLIPKFERTKQFNYEEYKILVKFLGKFNKILTTPNILTEISNLSNKIHSNIKPNAFESFSKTIQLIDEKYIESNKVSNTKEFSIFGLTDAVICHYSKENYLVLSDDMQLTYYLIKKKVDAINFYHILGKQMLQN